MKKPKIVFAFIEAGLGHIVPMTAVCDAFERKYGDKAEIIKTMFYQDTNNPDMKHVEDELIKEVKLHNAKRRRGFFQFALMDIFGTRLSLKYLMEKRYKKGFKPSLEFLQKLNADLIFNTHFASLYCACEARERGLINSEIVAFCPDPVIGRQWDNRVDIIALSSAAGKEKAQKGQFKNNVVEDIPFLIRKQVEEFNKGKEYYRKELNIPQDNFTILLADGAYGAGKIRETVYSLMELKQKITIIAVCGKNENLYREFSVIKPPQNITFLPLGFTDKMLMLSACCDVFIGKAGASNLAEPCYFGAPQIITFCATPIEKWIAKHYTCYVKSAIKITDIKKVVKTIEKWIEEPNLMKPFKDACVYGQRTDGPDILADMLWSRLNEKRAYSSEISYINQKFIADF